MQTCAELLGVDGPLAGRLEGFVVRPQQQAMAEAVAAAIAGAGTLLCEAGTGTGKTFAYLVPALESGRRVIISTGTRHLQDQLFHRDLPVVRRALAASGTAALLKGRANYLCLHRLDQATAESGFLHDEFDDTLERVRSWSGRTRSGDIAELAEVPETAPVWPAVTSTADNCLGAECPCYQDCFVVKARREAAAADLVVVNHHLFLADMNLREEGFAELIPSADAVIFDEAHQLPDLATEFFGASLSSRQVVDLARDTARAGAEEAAEQAALGGFAAALERASDAVRAALPAESARLEWHRIEASVQSALDALQAALDDLAAALAAVAERGAALAHCARRAEALALRLAGIGGGGEMHAVRWIETHRRSFALHRTPVDVAETFQARLGQYRCAWIYTSATLAVGEDFGYFKARLGIEDATQRRWESPYHYREQALLYLPEIPIEPRDPDYTTAVIETALPVLEASRGRAFLLFTSHRALSAARALLADRLDFPLLVQGDAPRAELLERFRRTPNAVLLGTASFWEGVDVRGEALSCVIIDKLPFAVPDDPLLQARVRWLREQGRNAFLEFQLPEAVLALKQGVGRLIRDETDTGVLVICDPRIHTRGYGRAFLAALPEIPVTRNVTDVRRFFRSTGAAGVADAPAATVERAG
jgi:ATP-dependent DNA helicase DinG